MRRLVLMRIAAPDTVPRIAAELRWIPAPPAVDEQVHVQADYLNASGARVRWIDDSQSGWSYLLVPDLHVPSWRQALSHSGALLRRDEALTLLHEAPDTDSIRDATLLLGLLAHGTFDDEIFAALSATLLASSDVVRSAALTAITYAAWSEFGPLLRVGLQESGASLELQREGQEIADQLDAAQWNRSYYANDP